jgi:hypothetical protein
MDRTQIHHHPTITAALARKFAAWVEKSTVGHIVKTLGRFLLLAIMIAAWVAPSFAFGMLSAVAMNTKTAGIIAIVVVFFRARAFTRWVARARVKRRAANQHSWNGVPIFELADYILQNQRFTFEARADLHLAQKQWSRMAKELDGRGVLYKSPEANNARVLRPISREQLVRQLRDGFPLVWSEEKRDWIERNGPWRIWLGDQERKEQATRATISKLERKRKKLRAEVDALSPTPGFVRRQVSAY